MLASERRGEGGCCATSEAPFLESLVHEGYGKVGTMQAALFLFRKRCC